MAHLDRHSRYRRGDDETRARILIKLLERKVNGVIRPNWHDYFALSANSSGSPQLQTRPKKRKRAKGRA